MATRVNVMKLLQEMRGLAELTGRRPFSRTPGSLLVQFRIRSGRISAYKAKRFIPVIMKDRHDFPDPVAITHLPLGTAPH